MTPQDNDWKALERACCGNREAMQWLLLWRDYVHAIDDLVDGDARGPEALLATFAMAPTLYSHPFYLNNMAALRQVVLNCTNAYADSVMWERSPVPWQRDFADHYRHYGAEMVLAVAQICGGYQHMRSISPELRVICWHEHHTPGGKAC
jgi:hypothetical protein